MSKLKFAVLIMAAGEGRRLGGPKALLCDQEGDLLLRRCIALCKEALSPITELECEIFIGLRADSSAGVQLPPLLEHQESSVHCLLLERASEGMGSAIAESLRNILEYSNGRAMGETVAPEPAGLMILPVDLPALRPSSIESVARTWLASPEREELALRPQCLIQARGPKQQEQARHGHPVVFARSHFSALAQLSGEQGAKPVFAAAQHGFVVVDDPGIYQDIDTPEAYRAYFGAAPRFLFSD